MSTSEKSRFVAESLSLAINKRTVQFKKSNKKLLKSIEDSMDSNGMRNLMVEAIAGTLEVMAEWEEKSLPELDGSTPKQYFESLSTINDIVELVSFIEVKITGILPNGLSERIKALEDSITDDLLAILQSMKLDESKCFNPTQKAAIQIAEISALPKFGDSLVEIISQLDNEKSDEDTFTSLMNAIRVIGGPILETLICLVENSEKKGALYAYLMLTIGKMASENKSERMYRLLKDYFRKSETKVIESSALAVYGDGRAIPAIRGYVEQNLDDLSYWEYSQLKENVSILGGDMTDLDSYFDDYEDFDECDEEGYDEEEDDEAQYYDE